MKFTPQTEEQIQANAYSLLPDGIYDFTVVYAEDKVSHAGNEYISLKLSVYDEQGRERLIFSHLAFIKLLKHFCDIAGLEDKYQAGEVSADDCMHKMGKADIGIEKGKPKPEGGFYPDKNIVKDYVKKSNCVNESEINTLNDALPF